MLSGNEGAQTYARGKVFATIMIILNGILGICIWVGSPKYKEQFFITKSATIYLVSLVVILVLTLILSNYTSTAKYPYYSDAQWVFIHWHVLQYMAFFMFQTVRHRNYFVEETPDNDAHEAGKPSTMKTIRSLVLLVVSLAIVIGGKNFHHPNH